MSETVTEEVTTTVETPAETEPATVEAPQSERKRRVEEQQLVAYERVAVLIDALTSAVDIHVRDQAIRSAIAAEFLRITSIQSRQALTG